MRSAYHSSNFYKYSDLNFLHAHSDEAQEAEALQVLHAIFNVRQHQPDQRPEVMTKITLTLAMLYFVLHDIERVGYEYM